jgi:ketosteroid isomerase-like protein
MDIRFGMHWLKGLALSLGLLTGPLGWAQGDAADPRAADRAQLRTLMYGVEGAFNARDVAALTTLLAEDPSVYWLDGQHTATKAEIQAHYQRMFGSEAAPLKAMRLKAQLGAPAQFHGDTALAFGTTTEHYELRRGGSVDLEGRWTAVCVKQGDAFPGGPPCLSQPSPSRSACP